MLQLRNLFVQINDIFCRCHSPPQFFLSDFFFLSAFYHPHFSIRIRHPQVSGPPFTDTQRQMYKKKIKILQKLTYLSAKRGFFCPFSSTSWHGPLISQKNFANSQAYGLFFARGGGDKPFAQNSRTETRADATTQAVLAYENGSIQFFRVNTCQV